MFGMWNDIWKHWIFWETRNVIKKKYKQIYIYIYIYNICKLYLHKNNYIYKWIPYIYIYIYIYVYKYIYKCIFLYIYIWIQSGRLNCLFSDLLITISSWHPTSTKMRHKALLMWELSREPWMLSDSKNTLGSIGIPLKRGTSGARQ